MKDDLGNGRFARLLEAHYDDLRLVLVLDQSIFGVHKDVRLIQRAVLVGERVVHLVVIIQQLL